MKCCKISIKEENKYNVGDIFQLPKENKYNLKFLKFDGLEIKNITYGFGIFLHFDYNEWKNNIPNLNIDGKGWDALQFKNVNKHEI